ncbi:MAG TPA: ABC transporter permease, partial [Myxococcota bacterium]|nr:ABC transporter permease [Myxococcota bacterium]
MNVRELFFQSSLVNALAFLWIASAATSTRMLIRRGVPLSRALVSSVIFGPLALIVAFLYEGTLTKSKEVLQRYDFSYRSLIAIILVSIFSITIFYYLFVKDQAQLAHSSEALLSYMALILIVLGLVGGLILAGVVRRVAFFEASFCTAIFAIYAISLDRWADQVFSYGTSAVYFTTLLLTATFLFFIFLTIGGSVGYLLFGEGRLNVRFSYESFLGWRFLMTKRSSQVVSLITVISIIAVTIACGGMIVVMSVMNGFSSDLRSKILGANAHLMVQKYGKDFTEYDKIVKLTSKLPGVISANPFVLNEGMISSKNNLSGAIIKGFSHFEDNKAQILKYVSQESLDYLQDPTKIPIVHEAVPGEELVNRHEINDLPGVIIGKEMSNDLQVYVGEIVNIISPVGELGPTGPIPKAKPFRVAGLFYSGMYEYDAKFAFMRLKDAQEFFNLKNSVTGVEYRVLDIEKTKAVAQEIEKAIGGYPFYTRDWMQMNRNMFSALQLEKIAMLIILGTLIFMASLLILVTLIMVVMEKGKEIAILKSMGATDASVMKIFVVYGLSVGGLGAFLGGVLGIALCFVVKTVGIRLDPDI